MRRSAQDRAGGPRLPRLPGRERPARLIEAGTRKPDLVILDLGLPDLDGIEVIRQLRAWSRVPIIVLSARDQEAQKVAALDAGADDYLTKPFGAAELLCAGTRLFAPCSHGPGERRAERFFRGALEGRFIEPQGLDPRPGSPFDPDRVSPAVGARQARRQDAHAPATAARRLG